MKCNICFVDNSFDFSLKEEQVTESFAIAGALVDKMSSAFVQFSKSIDFDQHAAEVITSGIYDEVGHLFSALYDGKMSSIFTLTIDSIEATNIANTPPSELDSRLLGLYGSEGRVLTGNEGRSIYGESCLVSYSSKILSENARDHREYAQAFKDVYTNLIFLTNSDEDDLLFNRINKIQGGFSNFIIGITTCLEFLNSYTIIPDDSLKNIDYINAGLEVPVTPEGTGKNSRKRDELKRDFYIDKVKYENINCEYHCKLGYVDGGLTNGKAKPNRIYFGFLVPDKSGPKIAIAHIGDHL